MSYNIGDIGPAGGWIFYYDSVNNLYYEAAPTDDALRTVIFGYGIDFGTDIGIGSGQSNTDKINSFVADENILISIAEGAKYAYCYAALYISGIEKCLTIGKYTVSVSTIGFAVTKTTEYPVSIDTEDLTFRGLAVDELSKIVVAVGDGVVAKISYDSVSKTFIGSFASKTPSESNSWESVVFDTDNNIFVACSSDGTNRIMTSPDGETWTARTPPVTWAWSSISFAAGKGLICVASNNSNQIIKSNDGIAWTAYSCTLGNWNEVKYITALGLFVAVGTSIMTSPDGETWTEQSSSLSGAEWSSLAWGDGFLYLISKPNLLGDFFTGYSIDGISYEIQSYSSSNMVDPVLEYDRSGDYFIIGTGSSSPVLKRDYVRGYFEKSATAYCSGFSKNGFSDWFLPSKDEGQKIYENLIDGDNKYPDKSLWTSSQHPTEATETCYGIGPLSGLVAVSKSTLSSAYYAVPVRSFTPPPLFTTYYKGRSFLLQTKISGSWVTVSGGRSTGMTINGETVDITDKENAPWRVLLEDAGIKSVSLTQSGIFNSSAAQILMIARARTHTIDEYRILPEDGTAITGFAQVTSIERSGEYGDAENYSITLESSDIFS